MTEDEEKRLVIWLRDQTAPLEKALAEGFRKFVAKNCHPESEDWFRFQCVETQNELRDIGAMPIAYDRLTIGAVYGSWYLGRRINQALEIFMHQFRGQDVGPTVELWDLGCGTLAVQTAVALLSVGAKECGIRFPAWEVHNVDSSGPMLDYGKNYFWPAFEDKFGPLDEITSHYRLASWQSARRPGNQNLWATASYLFDKKQDLAELQEEVQRVAKDLNPDKLIVWTSDGKADLLKALNVANYSKPPKAHRKIEGPLMGEIPSLNLERKKLGLNDTKPVTFRSEKEECFVVTLARLQRDLAVGSDATGFKLHTGPATSFKDAILTEQQETAATALGEPTKIVGPAGSGKSLVLLRRVEAIIRREQRLTGSLKILLTSFNKALIKSMADQIEPILEIKPTKVTPGNPHYEFELKDSGRLTLMHFDVIPRRIGKLPESPLKAKELCKKFAEIAMALRSKTTGGLEALRHEEIITSGEFLLEEYERCIFGRNCRTLDAYLDCERPRSTAFPINLNKNGAERKFVWDVVRTFEEKWSCFTTKRRKLAESLQDGGQSCSGSFTHVLVDEAQDCAESDYHIFYGLLADPNNLTIAGDLAQSIHLGRSARLPRDGERKQKRWKSHEFQHSIRIPYWIAEAISPLSEKLVLSNPETSKLQSTKRAVPGSRPIVIWSDDKETLALKIFDCYHRISNIWKDLCEVNSNSPAIQVLEQDPDLELVKKIRSRGVIASQGSILSLKGLERKFLVWSLNVALPGNEPLEAAYTIATRTSAVLVIACAGEPHRVFQDLDFCSWFDKTHLLPWDESSKTWMDDEWRKSDLRRAQSRPVISLNGPITVKDFATRLKVKPFKLIANLIAYKVFVTGDKLIDEELQFKLAEKHGFDIRPLVDL